MVEKAHANPRFVEDCVREMIRQVAEAHRDLADSGCFVLARQENLETIHRHNVVAERFGELGEVLAELDSGERSPHHMTMREWLEAPAQPKRLAGLAPPAPVARRLSSISRRTPKK